MLLTENSIGPSNWMRPTSSSLKRKYSNVFTSESEDDEDVDQDEITKRSEDIAGPSGQGSFRPKKLFKGGLYFAIL